MFREGCTNTSLIKDKKNHDWYKECYPDMDGLNEESAIINAGIVIGGYESMINYLSIVWKMEDTTAQCDMATYGPDQGVVEYAYYNDMFKELIDRVEIGPVYCNNVERVNQVLYDEYKCLKPFIHGRPPFYPQEWINNGLLNYTKLVALT